MTTPETSNDDRSWDRLPGKAYGELPAAAITLNQLVAYNMAYFRKAAGLTQEDLGKLLRGWTQKPWGKAAVSAAERAWDGKRPRLHPHRPRQGPAGEVRRDPARAA
ncbi:hypothetical protein AB0C69_10905, partial [Actinomadura sp. NPDC048032]|uniref:hypothetical protein n=1 Tax=Actinomadura sp. NPDC048032 TaxID=3155747 RepID=UPI0033EF4C77